MNEQSASSSTTTATSTMQLLDNYAAAWNTRDGAAVVASLAPGGTYVNPQMPAPASGDELAGYIAALATAFPDFAFTYEAFDCGQQAFIHWTMTGTYTGPLPGVPGPTGASFTIRGLDRLEIDADGIRSVDNYFDQVNQLQQLGINVELSVAESGSDN